MRELSVDFLDDLVEAARNSPRRRQHWNLHRSYDDRCQRLLNAIGVDSYIRPHRHCEQSNVETLVAVRGSLALVLFDDAGNAEQIVPFGTERGMRESTISVGVEISNGEWHTIVACEPESIIFEIKNGPFLPECAKEYAPWSPEEGAAEADAYFQKLRSLVKSRSA